MNRMKFILLSLMVSVVAMAQEKIEKIAKELESKGVEATVVVKRNSESKKVYLRTQVYKFKSAGGKYANQLVEAFKSESENADEAVMNKPATSFSGKGGKNEGTTKRYQLVYNEGTVKKIYMLDITSYKETDPSVKLQMVMRDRNVPANKGDYDVHKYDYRSQLDENMLNLNDFGELFSKENFLALADSMKAFDWDGFGKAMDDLGKQLDNSFKEGMLKKKDLKSKMKSN